MKLDAAFTHTLREDSRPCWRCLIENVTAGAVVVAVIAAIALVAL